MKFSSLRIIATSLLVAFSASPAYAATAVCIGLVSEVGNHLPGGVYVQVADGGLTKICDLTTTQFGVTAANCKQHLATAQLAVATGKTVSLWIDNAPTTACSSIVPWSISDTRYFAIRK
jgi:hypothetical protein